MPKTSAGAEGFLAGERDWPDGALDDVGTRFDAAVVIQEEPAPVPRPRRFAGAVSAIGCRDRAGRRPYRRAERRLTGRTGAGRVVDYMRANLATDIPLGDLVAVTGLSRAVLPGFSPIDGLKSP